MLSAAGSSSSPLAIPRCSGVGGLGERDVAPAGPDGAHAAADAPIPDPISLEPAGAGLEHDVIARSLLQQQPRHAAGRVPARLRLRAVDVVEADEGERASRWHG